jgi:hypothetical protein
MPFERILPMAALIASNADISVSPSGFQRALSPRLSCPVMVQSLRQIGLKISSHLKAAMEACFWGQLPWNADNNCNLKENSGSYGAPKRYYRCTVCD